MTDWNDRYAIVEDDLAAEQPDQWVVSALAGELREARSILNVEGVPEQQIRSAFSGDEVARTLVMRRTGSGPAPRRARIYRMKAHEQTIGGGESREIRARQLDGQPDGLPNVRELWLDHVGIATTDEAEYAELSAAGLEGSRAMEVGDFDAAEQHFLRSLELARKFYDPASMLKACGSLGAAKSHRGQSREALLFMEEALTIARENSLLVEEGQTLTNLADAYAALGDTERALALSEERHAIGIRIGDVEGIAYGSANVGVAHFKAQEFSKAIEPLEAAAESFRSLDMWRDAATAYEYLGFAYQALGDAARCIKAYKSNLEIWRRAGDLSHAAVALTNLSDVLHHIGRSQEAIALAEEGYAALKRSQSPHASALEIRLKDWKRA